MTETAKWEEVCSPGVGDYTDRMAEAGFKVTKHTPGTHGLRGFIGIAVLRPDPADWTDR